MHFQVCSHYYLRSLYFLLSLLITIPIAFKNVILCNKQDTATVLLSAALASKKPEPSSSSSTDVASVEQGEPSSLHDPSSLAGNEALNVEAEPSNDPEALVEQQVSIFGGFLGSIHFKHSH